MTDATSTAAIAFFAIESVVQSTIAAYVAIRTANGIANMTRFISMAPEMMLTSGAVRKPAAITTLIGRALRINVIKPIGSKIANANGNKPAVRVEFTRLESPDKNK